MTDRDATDDPLKRLPCARWYRVVGAEQVPIECEKHACVVPPTVRFTVEGMPTDFPLYGKAVLAGEDTAVVCVKPEEFVDKALKIAVYTSTERKIRDKPSDIYALAMGDNEVGCVVFDRFVRTPLLFIKKGMGVSFQ